MSGQGRQPSVGKNTTATCMHAATYRGEWLKEREEGGKSHSEMAVPVCRVTLQSKASHCSFCCPTAVSAGCGARQEYLGRQDLGRQHFSYI
jgi:hypothetical protein